MSSSIYSRTVGLLGLATLIAGCASKPLLSPAGLPPEAALDDGVDYYSAALTEDNIFDSQQDQWTTDEDGNRVYLINQVRRGSAAAYYVGDIRYALANENRDGVRTGPGQTNNQPFSVNSRLPQQNRPLRGSTNNMLYQNRRGRITYLPTRTRPQSQSNGSSSSNTSTSGGSSQPSRPASPPRTTRRSTAPQSNRSQRRSSPGNTTRRQDR
ncbi:MAG: hypothetical protein AB8G18_12370 [Gammaproteobacteria bacterium]